MKQYFNKKSKFFPDYDFWLKCEYWEYECLGHNGPGIGTEVMWLLMNIEPRLFKEHPNPFFEKHSPSVLGRRRFLSFLDYYETQRDISMLLERGFDSNKIEARILRTQRSKKVGETSYDCMVYQIKPTDLIRWAVSVGLRIADPFLVLLDPREPEGTTSSRHLFVFDKVTSWNQVAIIIINPIMAKIIVGSDHHHKNYEELGFKGYGDSESIPWIFFKAFASHGGVLKPDYLPTEISSRKNIKNDISGIRKKLYTLFPNIHEDPIIYDETSKLYRAQFKLAKKADTE